MLRNYKGDCRDHGFSLIELLVVIVIISVIAALLLPALSTSKDKAHSLTCAGNIKQLQLAWLLYADDNADRLVNNHGVPETLAKRQNWVNNVQDWESSDDNTNLTYLTDCKLAPFTGKATAIFKCPSDRAQAPNGDRIRSMSMNALMGDPGQVANQFNPDYLQFFKKADVTTPAGLFVFLDEHADTLNDGFFVNRLDDFMWGNVPGSYHRGGMNLSFADGHIEARKWKVNGTVRPVQKARIEKFAASPRDDFEWLKVRSSVRKSNSQG